LPAELAKAAVSPENEARAEETSKLLSADAPSSEAEAVAKNEPSKTELTAEKETEKSAPMQMTQSVKPSTSSSELHNGDVRIVDREKKVYILGFG